MAAALLGPFAAADTLPVPQLGETRLTAVVEKADFPARTLTISIESAKRGDGTEVFYGSPLKREVKVPYHVPISWLTNQDRWLSLKEVKTGQPMLVIADDNMDTVVVKRLTIPLPDPLRPTGGHIYAPQNLGIEPDRVCMDPVTVPMLFPIAGQPRWSDTFLASRGGGTRRHKGQDLMVPKMTPLVAVFDGQVALGTGKGNAGNTITVVGDCGWNAEYYHVNNDSPGTDDGKGTADYAFAPGLRTGDRVYAGQFLGWVGDSGNAEGTSPHLHFELWSQETGACYNATPSLIAAQKLRVPLVNVPAPDLPLKKGQVRTDGVLRQIDLARNVIVVDALSTQTKQGENTPVKTPTRKYFKLGADSTLRISGNDQPVPLSALIVGDRLTVVGGEAPAGQSVTLQDAYAVRIPGGYRQPELSAGSYVPQPAAKTESVVKISLSGPSDEFARAQCEAVLAPINAFRASKGLNPMTFDLKLAQAAQTWANRMMDEDFFDTNSPDGTSMLALTKPGTSGMVSSSVSADEVGRSLVRAFADVFSNPEFDRLGVGHGYLDYDTGRVRVQHYWSIVVGRS